VENAHQFHNDLPNDKLVIIDNSGHTPMEENPIESIAHVIEFLKTSRFD
jgi:pimeloyl-ACP methyl ester carboxylesterase